MHEHNGSNGSVVKRKRGRPKGCKDKQPRRGSKAERMSWVRNPHPTPRNMKGLASTRTVQELSMLIGRKVMFSLPIGVEIPVTVLNARKTWGRDDLLITPHRGHGSAWVQFSPRLRFVEEWPDESAKTDEPFPAETS